MLNNNFATMLKEGIYKKAIKKYKPTPKITCDKCGKKLHWLELYEHEVEKHGRLRIKFRDDWDDTGGLMKFADY